MKPDIQDKAKDVDGCTMGHELFGGPGTHTSDCEPRKPLSQAQKQAMRNEYKAEMKKHYDQVRKDKAEYTGKKVGKNYEPYEPEQS